GTSFVTLDMFGRYRYGSDLLNVSHDPGRPEEFASFGFDDEGTPSGKRMLIEAGILRHPLGGSLSSARVRALHDGTAANLGLSPDFTPDFSLDAVATARASSWNRAPIDRMSNLNIEPGDTSLADM